MRRVLEVGPARADIVIARILGRRCLRDHLAQAVGGGQKTQLHYDMHGVERGDIFCGSDIPDVEYIYTLSDISFRWKLILKCVEHILNVNSRAKKGKEVAIIALCSMVDLAARKIKTPKTEMSDRGCVCSVPNTELDNPRQWVRSC